MTNEEEAVPETAEIVPMPVRSESAVERAAQAALDQPGIAGRDEFLSLAMQARLLSMSGAAPEAVRGNPYIAFHVAMVGRDLRISPSAAMQLVDVIGYDNRKPGGGDKIQISLSPQLLLGQVRRLGLGNVVPHPDNKDASDWAGALAIGPGGEKLGETVFTWEDAIEAGLVMRGCLPGAHKQTSDGRCKCRQGWRTYSRRMLWWRAAGYCVADYFPEAGLGLYSPEELGAVVDADGRALDPATVELPEGYEPAAAPSPTAGTRAPLADPDDLWELQVRIHSLPPTIQQRLRQSWSETNALAGDGTKVLMAHSLPASAYRVADALVASFERQAAAESEGWNTRSARHSVRKSLAVIAASVVPMSVPGSAQAAQEAPEPAAEPATADPAPEAQDGAPVAESGEGGANPA